MSINENVVLLKDGRNTYVAVTNTSTSGFGSVNISITVNSNTYSTSSAIPPASPPLFAGGWTYFTRASSTALGSRTTGCYTGSALFPVTSMTPADINAIVNSGDPFTVCWDANCQVYDPLMNNLIIPDDMQKNVGQGLPIESWDNTSDGINFICICLIGDTFILTPSGEIKIQDLKRGDEVITEHGILKICRISKTPNTGKLTIIKKGNFDEFLHMYKNLSENNHITSLPYDDIISTNNHPFWIDGKRITTRKLVDMGKAEYLDINESEKYHTLYNLQFEIETSFYANGLQCDAISPYFTKFYLPKELYFDESKYDDKIMTNSDQWRAKKKEIPRVIK